MSWEVEDHCFQGNVLVQGGEPYVFEFSRVDVADYVGDVEMAVFPETDEVWPVLILIVLDGDPAVVVAMICVVGENKWAFLVLEVDDSMRVVGGGIDHVACDLFDGAVLAVAAFCNNIFGLGREFRLPLVNQGKQLFAD